MSNQFVSGAITGIGVGWLAHSWALLPAWAIVAGMAGMVMINTLEAMV